LFGLYTIPIWENITFQRKGIPMSVAIQQSFVDAEDWKSSFISFISNRLDELEGNFPMESITDISKSLFQNRSEIMGQAALALIEKKFSHLLDQRVCECPHCHRRIKAKSEKVRMKPQTDDAKDQIEKTLRYLDERKDMVNYGSLKRGGFHIGSGGIESSNKFIANVRLKRSGAWWYPSNANNILKLRCAKYNKTFDRIMEKRKLRMKQRFAYEQRPNLHLIADNA
jgi:hypothetical protein